MEQLLPHAHSGGHGHPNPPTRLEDVDEAHEQRAELLAVESMLLFTHFHFQLLCNNVL